MAKSSATNNVEIRLGVAGLLTWLLPGAGHLFIGERNRGLIFMIVIGVTYWIGVAVGGVENTINIDERRLWFVAQICAGGHALATMAWDGMLDEQTSEQVLRAYGRADEVAIVYTAISGMLNILVFFDVLGRAERSAAGTQSPAQPRAAGGKA